MSGQQKPVPRPSSSASSFCSGYSCNQLSKKRHAETREEEGELGKNVASASGQVDAIKST